MSQDNQWADFLSKAAKLEARDSASTQHVLSALHDEQHSEQQRGNDPKWSAYLSGGAVLRPIDLGAVQPVLRAMQTQRQKQHKLNLTRVLAGCAAAAIATAAAFALVILLPSPSADPSEAYNLYSEANTGW